MRITAIALACLVSTVLHTSVTAETIIKAPNAITCDEYLKLLTSAPELPGIVNEDLLKLNAYHSWGVGYIQGKDPTLFPAIIKQSGKTVTPDEEFGVYLGFVSSIYSRQCKKRGNMKLEELTKIMVERLPATFK